MNKIIINDAADSSEIICTMVLHAYENVDNPRVVNARDSYFPNTHRAEFGTVKICMPRQMGHTTAAIRMLFALDDAVLYVPNASAKSIVRGRVNELTKHFITRHSVLDRVRIAGDKSLHLRPLHPKSMVILDMTQMFAAEHRKNIYDAHRDVKLIVELQ